MLNRNYLIALAAILIASPAYAQYAANGNTTLSVAVGVEAALRVDTVTTAFSASTIFSPYTGTTNLFYKIRTSQGTGTGSITAQVTSDFSPAGGPSVGTPPTTGDALTYTCTAASPATGCSTAQTASTTTATSVATFGAGAHSSVSGNAASTSWTLTNDPKYNVGAYTSTVTYTISAT